MKLVLVLVAVVIVLWLFRRLSRRNQMQQMKAAITRTAMAASTHLTFPSEVAENQRSHVASEFAVWITGYANTETRLRGLDGNAWTLAIYQSLLQYCAMIEGGQGGDLFGAFLHNRAHHIEQGDWNPGRCGAELAQGIFGDAEDG